MHPDLCFKYMQIRVLLSHILNHNVPERIRSMNDWTIRGNLIPTDDKATHLGIVRDTYSSGIASTIQQNITKGRKAAYRLLGAGLHGKYGLPPEVLRNMFQAYVVPVLCYGLEIVLPDGRHLETIEKEYRMLLIALLGLPNNVASAI